MTTGSAEGRLIWRGPALQRRNPSGDVTANVPATPAALSSKLLAPISVPASPSTRLAATRHCWEKDAQFFQENLEGAAHAAEQIRLHSSIKTTDNESFLYIFIAFCCF